MKEGIGSSLKEEAAHQMSLAIQNLATRSRSALCRLKNTRLASSRYFYDLDW